MKLINVVLINSGTRILVLNMNYSIIIPIYNAEKTLCRCLDSLLLQLNSDTEVLLINDGSTDLSGQICKEYVQKNTFFRYFEQQNSGVSTARNKGLDNAIGDYVLFVDSDDYVESTYFDAIKACVTRENPDLLIFCAVFPNRNQYNRMVYYDQSYDGLDTIKQYADLSKKQQMFALWNKVFVRQIIENNNIRFAPNSSIGEDGAFIFKYILHTNKLTSISNALYYVDESNTGSLSRKKRDDLCDVLTESYIDLYKTLNQTTLNSESAKIYQEMLSRAFYRSAYSCFNEVFSYGYDKKTINDELLKICTAYKEVGIPAFGRDARILSLPVKLKLIPVIRLLFFVKNRGRKTIKQ